jgi:putative tricarboxylic transport membrane protein
MRLNDALLGAILLAFAAWVWWMTTFFPAFPGQDYGPNLFPRVLAACIALCGVLLVLRGWRQRGAIVALDESLREPGKLLSWLLIPGAVLFYMVAATPLGFIPTSFALLLAMFLWFRARPVVALPVAAGMTLLVHWFFADLMRVPLPRGVLDSVL